MKNLAESLEKAFREYIRELQAVEELVLQKSQLSLDSNVEIAAVPAPTPEKADLIYAQQSREKRLANYEKTKELYAQGWTQKKIAQHLEIGVKTVSRYLKQPTFLERQYRKDRGQGVLDPYRAHLGSKQPLIF